jgi:hypothetical protein
MFDRELIVAARNKSCRSFIDRNKRENLKIPKKRLEELLQIIKKVSKQKTKSCLASAK